MKSLVKDIVLFILGVIVEMYVNFLVPYLEATRGHGDGFVILVPIFVAPVIGFVMGMFIERKFKLAFPVIPAVFIFLLMAVYGQIVTGYIFICFFGTLAGIGIGWGIRALATSLAEKIRYRRAKK